MGIVKYIFSIFFVVCAFYCAAQPDPMPIQPPPPPPPFLGGVQGEEPLVYPEVMPAYPGGEIQMMTFQAQDLKALILFSCP